MPVRRLLLLLVLLISTTFPLLSQTEQIAIPRIERMPNQPMPYTLRDWKQVAVDYDNFVYDFRKTGQYLPLGAILPSGLNYSQRPSFRLDTYVGTFAQNSREAINMLPSLVGASLVGVDKTDHYGQNWVLMSQDFYNKVSGENIYLNGAVTSSGNDWWYDLMPNVFFYQLYDLYPNIGGEATLQFNSVAEHFLEAVKALGGSATPWQAAYFNYRAFNFQTLEPNAVGVPEPEAAGAFAWVLYHAYQRTQNSDYLQGAEWSLEFLEEWTRNPSYELMLPYGTLTAAKMNAEIGTNYDVEKMVNWSFDKGNLRNWGTIVGNWGGFDVDGLVGEANDGGNDYAFQLNGVQQAAALVPMVRYDKRFARAIGKWTLNLANATRLFFTGFLPNVQQDASDWSQQYDPQRVIGYEALREASQGLSPFSTGDPLVNGWGATNLSLYSTSSIGYLGAIVAETNVEQILQLDLLATDFYHQAAYPSYLYYNPYPTVQTVIIEVGSEPIDVYDALTETFIQQNVSGLVSITIPADEAIMVILTPSNGTVTYDDNKMLIDDIIVDYQQNSQAFTYAPRIKAFEAAANLLEIGDTTTIYLSISDADSEEFTYTWATDLGALEADENQTLFTAPMTTGTANIQVTVTDADGNMIQDTLQLTIVPEINYPPQIISIQTDDSYIAPEEQTTFTAIVTDEDNDALTYSWAASGGIFSGTGSIINWTAPMEEGSFSITLTVTDEGGLSSSETITILVKTFTSIPGELIAFYPFEGNADDISGNNLDGQSMGTVNTTDRLGNRLSAYYFNGGAQHIRVENDPILNTETAITVSTWFKANALPDRETFLLSHGSWQNRWKISITPEKLLRWTINTTQGIRDLDAPTPLNLEEYYHVAATYDGELMVLYINGALVATKSHSGTIRSTTFPFLMGQMLPDETMFNFKGLQDEVALYNYALIPSEVEQLYEQGVTKVKNWFFSEMKNLKLYPNPTSSVLAIELPIEEGFLESWQIIDTHGKVVAEQQGENRHFIQIDVEHFPSGIYFIKATNNSEHYLGRFFKE